MSPQLMLDYSETSDCLRACIATLLNEQIRNVPHFTAIQGMVGEWDAWWLCLQDFLAVRGLAFIEMALTEKTPLYSLPNEVLCLFAGNTPKGTRHVVVGKIKGSQTIQLFDPSPQRPGIVNVDSVCFLVPVDPALIHRDPISQSAENLAINVHKDTRWIVETQAADGTWWRAEDDCTSEQEANEVLLKCPLVARLRVNRILVMSELLQPIPASSKIGKMGARPL